MNFNIDFVSKGLPRKIDQIQVEKPLDLFLSQTLFGQSPVMGNDKMDKVLYDWRKQSTVTLPEESLRGADADRVNFRTGFNSDIVTPNYYNKKVTVELDEADARVFGEEINAENASQQRVATLFAEKAKGLKDQFDAAKEKMAADAIFNGAVANKDGSQAYPMTSSLLSLTGSTLYSDPLKTIGDAWLAIRKKNKGFRATSLIMNPDDAYRLLSSQKGQSLIKTDELNLMKVQFGTENNGCQLFGTIMTAAGLIGLYAYYGTYDNAGTETNLIPQGKAILCGGAIGKFAYGRLKDATSGEMPRYIVAQEKMATYKVGNGDDAHFELQYQTAPIPVISAIDGYGVLASIPNTVA